MSILVIGSTGHIGSEVINQLTGHGADIRALVKDSKPTKFPADVTPVKGDVTDMDSMRQALAGVTTLFLLNPVANDELTRAQLTLNLTQEAGIQRVVYFSMVNADTFADVPHATAKYATERMIQQFDIPATILRPNYFFQNDAPLEEPLTKQGLYPMPIGSIGAAMIDMQDIAEAAALFLLRRENAPDPLPTEVVELSGPEVLTGEAVAAIWADVLGRPVAYAGDDLAAFEQRSKAQMPGWLAYDTALMFRGFHRAGMLPGPGAVDALTRLLGHAPRSYRSFAEETAAQWRE
jgi:uncharacterized protein YbjT (DUF2867 family)